MFLPDNYIWQILSYLILTSVKISYVAIYLPFDIEILNFKEIFNESLVAIAGYPLLIYSDWAMNEQSRTAGGWFVVSIILL